MKFLLDQSVTRIVERVQELDAKRSGTADERAEFHKAHGAAVMANDAVTLAAECQRLEFYAQQCKTSETQWHQRWLQQADELEKCEADRESHAAECQRITERLHLAAEVKQLLVIFNREQEWRIKAESYRDRLAADVQRLTDEIETLRARLPAEMPNCTIVFKECAKGHSWLTATNWVQHDCPTCALMNDAERAEGRMPL